MGQNFSYSSFKFRKISIYHPFPNSPVSTDSLNSRLYFMHIISRHYSLTYRKDHRTSEHLFAAQLVGSQRLSNLAGATTRFVRIYLWFLLLQKDAGGTRKKCIILNAKHRSYGSYIMYSIRRTPFHVCICFELWNLSPKLTHLQRVFVLFFFFSSFPHNN